MAKVKLILCDDEGNQIEGAKTQDYTLEVGNETLDEIEADVEQFRLKALPKLESDLLKVAQKQLTLKVKKTGVVQKQGFLGNKSRPNLAIVRS